MEKIKNYIIFKYYSIKEYLLCAKNRKKNLTAISFLIVIHLLLLISLSNAFYFDEANISIMQALIGDFDQNNYDYTLKIYLENDDNTGSKTYRLSDSIPNYNYTYSGYNCKNNSSLVYDEVNKVTNVTIDSKEYCSIYFDLVNHADIIVNIYKEDNLNTNNFTKDNYIPIYGYEYDQYICENNSELIINNNLHKIIVNTNNRDTCNIYYKKNKELIDIELYIEDGLNSNNYNKKGYIPYNINYEINSTKSKCYDSNNNIINTPINYINGILDIDSNQINTCEVYMDVSNE